MDKARRRNRLLPSIQLELLRLFVAGVPARTAAELIGVNRNTAGEVEVDGSYFGGHRKGKRGRGAAGKVPVFGLLKRGGLVHAVMIPDAKSPTLMSIIRERIKPDSIVYTDSFRAYDVLDVSEFQYHRINHSEEFTDQPATC